MSNDQLDQQVVELDNLSEHREIVTFMRRSAPLNTSQRTALEQYGHLILEYPVGDLRQHFEHPERPLTVEIGLWAALWFSWRKRIQSVTLSESKCMYRVLRSACMKQVWQLTYVYWMLMRFRYFVKCRTIASTPFSCISLIHGRKTSL